jgi:hypothetical protein
VAPVSSAAATVGSRAAAVGVLWNTVVTAAWLLPLLGFAALNATSPPSLPLTIVCAALVVAGFSALLTPDRWLASPARRRPRRPVPVLRAFGRVVPGGAIMNRLAGQRARSPLPRHATVLRALLRRTFEAERTHWWWLLTSAAVIVWAFGIGKRTSGLVLALLNIPLNVYPILLQRYIRARLARLARGRGIDEEER